MAPWPSGARHGVAGLALRLWLWASHSAFLRLSFLICKRGGRQIGQESGQQANDTARVLHSLVRAQSVPVPWGLPSTMP